MDDESDMQESQKNWDKPPEPSKSDRKANEFSNLGIALVVASFIYMLFFAEHMSLESGRVFLDSFIMLALFVPGMLFINRGKKLRRP